MIIAVDAGCAECYHASSEYPLIEARVFETVEEAKAHYESLTWINDPDWKPHPQGGDHIIHGQGSIWLMPAATELKEPKE
jgi:hypothetical protein